MPRTNRLQGFKAILERIKSNSTENLKLTHKEVIAYATSLLALAESDDISPLGSIYRDDEVVVLLACLASKGLNHYCRSFIAGEILAIVSEGEERNRSSYSGTTYPAMVNASDIPEDDPPF
jgi:hypothetical protein